MKEEFETYSSPAAIPFKWESAPGKPIEESLPATLEPRMSPLRPPPGLRKDTKSFKSAVVESKPDFPVVVEVQLAKKILMKLHKLRRKSMIAAACFTSDTSRVIEYSGQLFAIKDIDKCYDSGDAMSSFSVSTFGQRGTPCSTSFASSFSEPGRTEYCTDAATPDTIEARSSRSCCFEDADEFFDDTFDRSNIGTTLPGPRESAWHQFSGELERTYVPPNLHTRRSQSALIPRLLRHPISMRSFRYLSFGRSSRRSNMPIKNDSKKI